MRKLNETLHISSMRANASHGACASFIAQCRKTEYQMTFGKE